MRFIEWSSCSRAKESRRVAMVLRVVRLQCIVPTDIRCHIAIEAREANSSSVQF